MTILMILLALSVGIIEGAGVASFITLLDIIPRLAQITKSKKYVSLYEKIIGISIGFVVFARAIYLDFGLSKYFMIPISFIFGAFIGLLASALAETLDVMPVMERKIKLKKYLYVTLFALAFGKVTGSIVYWLVLIDVK